MVEYALVTVSAGLHTIATTTSAWIANVSWIRVGYVVLGLIAVRLLWGVLTRTGYTR